MHDWATLQKNMPIQIDRKIHLQKLKIFRQKNNWYFSYFCSKHILWVLVRPAQRGGSNRYQQSMFLSRNMKNNVYPYKPQFYSIKVGFKGVILYRQVFVMDISCQWHENTYMYKHHIQEILILNVTWDLSEFANAYTVCKCQILYLTNNETDRHSWVLINKFGSCTNIHAINDI